MRTLTPERKAILATMADGQLYTPSMVASKLGKERTSITQIMQKMVASGHLEQVSYGHYKIPHVNTCPLCGQVIHDR